MEEDVRNLDEAGADMVLTKPLRSTLLQALLKYVVNSGFQSVQSHRLVSYDEVTLTWTPR